MKPRITQIDFMGAKLWRCRGYGHDGIGITPMGSYHQWQEQWVSRLSEPRHHDLMPAPTWAHHPVVNAPPVFAPIVAPHINPMWIIEDDPPGLSPQITCGTTH